MKTHKIAITVLLIAVLCPVLMAGAKNTAVLSNTELARPDCTLTLASHSQGVFQNQNLNQIETTEQKTYKQFPRYKSEGKATLLAFIPGFIFHGAGHFYANDKTTGLILLSIEILSIIIASDKFPGIDAEPLISDQPYETGNYVTYVCLFVFMGSWAYDFVHASTAARNYNNKVRSQILFSSDEYNDIKVTVSFAF